MAQFRLFTTHPMKLRAAYLILLFLISGYKADAQDSSLAEPPPILPEIFELLSFSYGERFLISDYQSQFQTLQQTQFGQPINHVSVSFEGVFEVDRKLKNGEYYSWPGYFRYSHLIPANIVLNDTVNQRVRGFDFRMSLTGQHLLRSKFMDVYLTQGLYAGRIKLVDDAKRQLKNSNQGLFAGLMLKVKLGPLHLFVNPEFDLDVTPTQWRKVWVAKKQTHDLPRFRQSAARVSAGINFSPWRF